jgi:hypothetical protein
MARTATIQIQVFASQSSSLLLFPNIRIHSAAILRPGWQHSLALSAASRAPM